MDYEVQEGLIRDEWEGHIQAGSVGCMKGIALLAFGVPFGLALGTVIMLVVIFAWWLIPLAIVGYLAWRLAAGYSRGRG